MVEFSIMDCDAASKQTIAMSPYYIDFNIDYIMRVINACWKEDVSALYKYFPIDEKGQEYRKEIYRDVCKAGMYELLLNFRELMKQREKIIEDKEKTRSELQRTVMTLSEIKCYTVAIDKLLQGLEALKPEAKGMLKFLELLKKYASGDEFKKLYQESLSLRTALDSIPIRLCYQDHLLSVSFEEVDGKYDEFLKDFASNEQELQKTVSFFQRRNPFGDGVEISVFEDEVLEIVLNRYPKLFKELKQFVGNNADYYEEFLLQFADEIAFYLSFYSFEKTMVDKGLYFSVAAKSDNNRMMAEELYDLALACQLSREGQMPVANDTRLEDGENFFVLTGPNQGGKTTFARSLGQLVFFSKLGLPVPAKRAEVPFYSRILTHFSVEESVETGKGKLAEELSRLAPMMEDKSQKNDFVVINELFTTAANYDACIMGKRVLDHFIRQNCHGIYVTHLQELGREDKGIVSLRAMMNEEHRQNFKIVRSTAPALESSIILVEKHRLQYEQIISRLKGEEA